jgi:hypothetical protein
MVFYNNRLKQDNGQPSAMPAAIKELNDVIDAITTQVSNQSADYAVKVGQGDQICPTFSPTRF